MDNGQGANCLSEEIGMFFRHLNIQQFNSITQSVGITVSDSDSSSAICGLINVILRMRLHIEELEEKIEVLEDKCKGY